MYALLVQPTEAQTTGRPVLYVSMPGKRLSLVCCWGPAAFHFPRWICYDSFGGGYVCTFFKFCLYGKTGLIFKPDTIIKKSPTRIQRDKGLVSGSREKGLQT